MVHTWPVTLRDGDLVLRPLRRRDRFAFEALRSRNREWLRPWDATDPERPATGERGGRPPTYSTMRRWSEQQARDGHQLPLAIVVGGRLVGQVTAGPLQYGPVRSAVLGYWIDRTAAGRGVVPRAAALVIDHLFAEVGMHRVEVTVRPENTASLRVVEKLGLRPEGLRPRAVHVDGGWRDHLVFALTAEEVATDAAGRGMLRRVRERTRPQVPPDTPAT